MVKRLKWKWQISFNDLRLQLNELTLQKLSAYLHGILEKELF